MSFWEWVVVVLFAAKVIGWACLLYQWGRFRVELNEALEDR